MNQSKQPNRGGRPGKTGNRRIATRQMVTIGQRWQPRSRKRTKPPAVVIYQVHRGPDKCVLVYEDGDDPLRKGALSQVSFTDLRNKYKLIA